MQSLLVLPARQCCGPMHWLKVVQLCLVLLGLVLLGLASRRLAQGRCPAGTGPESRTA